MDVASRRDKHDGDRVASGNPTSARSEVVEILAGAVLTLLIEGRPPKAEEPEAPATEGADAGRADA